MPPRSPAGLTLLEILLAVALSLFVMAAVYTALLLHLRTAQWGPDQVQSVQSVRALIDQMTRDLRATVLPASVQLGVESSDAESEQTALEETDPYRSFPGGLWGTSDWLELIISVRRPQGDDAEVASLTNVAPIAAASLRRVTYAVTGTADEAAESGAGRLRLTRTEVPLEFASIIDEGTDSVAYKAASEVLADQLSYVQFQYWDDSIGSWTDSWGSDGPIAPPRAVKLIISRAAVNAGTGIATIDSKRALWKPYIERVIAIATYDPDLAAAALAAETGLSTEAAANSIMLPAARCRFGRLFGLPESTPVAADGWIGDN